VFDIALGAYLPKYTTLVPEYEGQYAAFKKDADQKPTRS
jgi:hypothetical protein